MSWLPVLVKISNQKIHVDHGVHNWNSMWDMNSTHTFPRFAYHLFHADDDPAKRTERFHTAVKTHGLLAGDSLVLDLESTASNDTNDNVAPDYGVSKPAVPKPWSGWTFWQKSESPIDRYVFNGTEAELLSWCRMPKSR